MKLNECGAVSARALCLPSGAGLAKEGALPLFVNVGCRIPANFTLSAQAGGASGNGVCESGKRDFPSAQTRCLSVVYSPSDATAG